jgi:hypothetical protein
MRWIQLLYNNRFSSLFEYEEEFGSGKIDWTSAVGDLCPLCGRAGCYRQISPYTRRAVELFPYREGMVSVARFQCREVKRTFSLLPYQLAPYHLYTVESMIKAVVLWSEILADGDGGAAAAVEELPGDCAVTPWLLRNWLGVVIVGLRAAHSVLCRWVDLSSIRSGEDTAGRLNEVSGYFQSLRSRGPPSRSALRTMVQRYSLETKRHLLGIPSQERRRLSSI